MPKYHVERSIVIDSSVETIKKSLEDYTQWEIWSPWLVMERDAKLIYSANIGKEGSHYDWKGELVGEGCLTLKNIKEYALEMELVFFKPFKSKARTSFVFEPLKDKTKVTWHMHSSLPFFLFWMKKKMEIFIGMDYERGLKMLKEYIETGTVASKVDINGKEKIKAQHYIGIERTCHFEELGKVMQKDFEVLSNFLKDKKFTVEGVPFSIYKTFDILKRESHFISCIPIEKNVEIDPNWVQGNIVSMEALKITHTGTYENIGNAWMAGFNYAQTKKIKTKKIPVGYEFYLNDPAVTEAKNLLTEIYLPLHS